MASSCSIYLGTLQLASVFPKLMMLKNCFYLFSAAVSIFLPAQPWVLPGAAERSLRLVLLASEHLPPTSMWD